MQKRFYITTPLYYVNASPHIGHSYTTIAADSLARYMRASLGTENVWFLTGTDEHGQKIQRAAEDLKLTPQEFADRTFLLFKDLWKELDISYNDFIRTTEDRHVNVVQRVLKILYEKGDIYEDKYEGWYCTPCETFWTDAQVPGELCPDCKRKVERISETNYFFRLSKYQEWLKGYIKDHPEFIRPATRYEEVSRFLELNTLTDLCISRPRERLSWGISLPFSKAHVTYVWFDALINYISAVGSFDDQGNYKSSWWPADLHLIGKDILRQHAIYWPIILRALDIELPKTVFAHGWWLSGEDKMSKSKGNVVSPVDMVRKFGIDVYRYFLLRDVPFGLDGNFSEGAIIKRFNGDLANDLGNLVYRTLTMVEKYYQGEVPQAPAIEADPKASQIRKMMEGLALPCRSHFGLEGEAADYDFSAVLADIWELIKRANKYVEETKPWNLAKENKDDELRAFMRLLVDVIRGVSQQIEPFMPNTAVSIQEQIGQERIKKADPLFPRIE